MRLSKQTNYAIRILIHCALHPDEKVKVADISREYKITEFNVFKIVPLLVNGGLLKTTRGRQGGVRLARPASDIRISDVVRLTEDPQVQANCFGEAPPACAIRPATPLNRIFNNAFDAFLDVLDQHSLADLANARRLKPGSGKKPALPDADLLPSPPHG